MAGSGAPSRDGKLIAALTAAQLYYMQDKTMEVIAQELGTSRSSVSRLLSFARESGLVDIRINSPWSVWECSSSASGIGTAWWRTSCRWRRS